MNTKTSNSFQFEAESKVPKLPKKCNKCLRVTSLCPTGLTLRSCILWIFWHVSDVFFSMFALIKFLFNMQGESRQECTIKQPWLRYGPHFWWEFYSIKCVEFCQIYWSVDLRREVIYYWLYRVLIFFDLAKNIHEKYYIKINNCLKLNIL